MADFPQDIINDILLNLPVKALVKFRCVSKHWHSLISDPNFIANHLRISSSDYNYTNHKIILTCTQFLHQEKFKFCASSMKSCSVLSLFNESSTDAVEIHSWSRLPLRYSVVGSCNGLLCITVGHDYVYLWNPSIRALRKLPGSGFKVSTHSIVTFGFGYDSSINDYKVIVIHKVNGSKIPKVKVYTLRPNCWRRIGDFDFREVPNFGAGLFVGGALNWAGVRFNDPDFFAHDDGFSWHILAIDLATEKQFVVPQPVNEDIKFSDKSLAELGECLCLLANYREKHFDIWVMKEYGVQESWCKMFTLSYDLNHFGLEGYPSYKPLLYSKNGELLLKFQSGLVLYNSEHATLRKPLINNFDTCITSITYVESLVSPNVNGRVYTLHQ